MRVLIADDHPAIRRGVTLVLKDQQLDIISDAQSGEEAYDQFCTHSPDIVIMDMNMPGIGGLESTRRIKSRDPGASVIIYSMHEEPSFAKQAFNAGASAYVLKSSTLNDLMKAIQEVRNGRHYLTPSLAQEMALGKLSGEKNSIDELTTREFEVLCKLAQGMKVREIAQLLNISIKTVATYQTQLKHKLNISSPMEMLKIALKYQLTD